MGKLYYKLGLTEETTPTSDDLFIMVDNPSGTPTTKKVSIGTLLNAAPGLSVNKSVSLGIDLLASGAAAPGVVKTVNYYGYAYKVNDDGYVRSFEMPYDWNSDTDVTFKIHWYCNNTSAGKYVKWQLDYSSVAEGSEEVNVGTTTDYVESAVSVTAYRLTESEIVIPHGNLAFDDVIGIQIKRIAASGGAGVVPDNYPVVISLEIEYTANKFGEAK